MPKILHIQVPETEICLKKLQKQYPSKIRLIAMLRLLKENGNLTAKQLSIQTGASLKSIQGWRSKYLQGGPALLLEDKRGGYKKAAISPKVHAALAFRLNNAKEGFRSFIEVQHWLSTEFGIEMGYHAVNKYVKRKFGAKLKVSRKSHVLKSPAAEAVFKNPVRKAGTY